MKLICIRACYKFKSIISIDTIVLILQGSIGFMSEFKVGKINKNNT